MVQMIVIALSVLLLLFMYLLQFGLHPVAVVLP
jgi:hypothetical protein